MPLRNNTTPSCTSNISTIFLSALTLMFVWFKLSGKLDWSWWLVFAPIWVPMAIGLLIVGYVWVRVLLRRMRN